MTRAIQKQIERSRQAKAGSKRVEVVLDERELDILDGMIRTLGPGYGYKDRASAIRKMIRHGYNGDD
jgi:hypothetical protein